MPGILKVLLRLKTAHSNMRISLSKDTSKSKPNEIFVNVQISEFDYPPEFTYSHSFRYIPSATDDKGNPCSNIIIYNKPDDSGEGEPIPFILEKCFNKKCKEENENPECVCPIIPRETNQFLVADISHTTLKLRALEDFGTALFKALFSYKALTVLKKTDPMQPNGGVYLHLNKHLDLDAIPWEYAKYNTYLVQQRKFTRMHTNLRELSQKKHRPPQRAFSLLTLRKLPLRIVVVAPDPIVSKDANMDLPDLHLNDQWQVFINEHFSNSKKVILENVYPPTVDQMDKLLKTNSEVEPVLHFMGHCVAEGDRKKLVFEDNKTGDLEYVDSLLPTVPENLRLAFLSTCNARDVARGLSERGILYTIGSYCPIPHDLARKFESKFYQLLANGLTIEKAMWGARVFFSHRDDKRDDRENYYFPGAMILYSSNFREADGTFECEEGMPIIKDHMPSNNLTLIPSASPFYGRKSELLGLLSCLREMATRNEEARKMCTIVGIGGQGKTALAMEAVRRAAHLFTGGIFAWQFGSTAISFSEYLRHLVNVIFPKYWDDENNAKGDLALSVQQKFVNYPSCLLILDHADTLKSAYKENDKDAVELISWLTGLTSNSAVKILATSHENLGWMKEYDDIHLKGFHELIIEGRDNDNREIDSGCNLLVHHLTTEAKEKRQSQLSMPLLRKIVTCMDGHPLSLVLLGHIASQQYFDKSLEDIVFRHYDTVLADDDAKERFKEHFEPMINSLTSGKQMLLYTCSLFTGPITAEVVAFFSYFIDYDGESTKNANYDIVGIEQILIELHSCELIIKHDGEYRIHVGLRQGIKQHNTLLKPSLNLLIQTVRDEVCIFGIVKSSTHVYDNARSNVKPIIRYYSIGNMRMEKMNVSDMIDHSIIKRAVRRQPPFLRLNVFIFEASETSNDFLRSCANWISEIEEGLPFILCSDKMAFSLMKEVAEILRDSLKETHWIIMTEVPLDPIDKPSPNLLADLQTRDIKEVFHDVPAPNNAFTGRSQILEDMATKLDKSSNPNGRRILALTGLGGMGKTQIMLRYCYLHREEYDFIFWLEMDGWSTATDSFRRLVINLGLDEESTKGKDFETLIGWVRTWLEMKKRKWLFLLANANNEEISKKVLNLLPCFGGNIILTTRKAIPTDKTIVITVQKMEKGEALQLLLGGDLTEKTEKIQDAQEIVDKLGCMPLAISLARRYVENQDCTLEDYLGNLKKKSESLLNYSSDHDKYTVGTVWLVSLDCIQAKNPRAIQILEDCAFLHPDGIPVRLFEEIYSNPKNTSTLVNELDIEQSIKAVQAAIEVLKQYSFLTQTRKELEGGKDNPQNNVLSIQRLVQTVIHDAISAERKHELVDKIAAALNQEMKFSHHDSAVQTPEIQRIMSAYIPHIRHLAALPIQIEVTLKEFEKVLTRGVHYLLTNRMYSGLEELAQRSIQLSKTINGSDHGNTATALNNLALLYGGQGKYDDARKLLEEVLRTREKVFGSKHAGTVRAMNNLASVYKSQGAFEKAEINFKKVLNIRKRSEKEKGKEKERERDIATSLNNLAGLYKSQGKYGEAESLYREASEIFEKEFGPEHLETATPLNNLAVTYYRQGKYEKSVGPQLKALAIRRKVLGPNHADTARTMNNLAGLYRSQGKYKEAKPLHQKALTICQTVLGPEDPDTATSLNNMAKLHELQGNYTEAGPLYEKALEIREKVLGPTNVITAESLHNLAAFHKIMGKYDEAEELHVGALAIRENVLGSEHPEAAESRNSLAVIYEIQGNYEKAEQWYQQALEIRENLLGEEHPDTAESLNNQARLYNNLSMYTEAEPLHTRALAIRKKMLGLNHPDTATSLNDQALLYINQSKVYNDQAKLQKAKLLTEQALTIRETALGSEHPDIASSLDNLALIYERQGRLDEAERQYERALTILKKAFGPEHPKFVETLEKLLFVQEKLRSGQDKHKELLLQSQEITGILALCNLIPALVQIFSRKQSRSPSAYFPLGKQSRTENM